MFTIIHRIWIFFAFYNLDIFLLTTKHLYYAWFFWSLSSNSLIMYSHKTKILWYSYVTIETSIVNHSYSSPVEINIHNVKAGKYTLAWNRTSIKAYLETIMFYMCASHASCGSIKTENETSWRKKLCPKKSICVRTCVWMWICC